MPRSPAPLGHYVLPPSACIEEGDLFYNHVLRTWTPVRASIGYRVDYWGLTIVRPYTNFQLRLTVDVKAFTEGMRKVGMSLEEFARIVGPYRRKTPVAGEGRTAEDTHRVEGGVLEGLR